MRPEVGFADLIRAIDRLEVTSYEEARAIAELLAPGSTLPAPAPPLARPPRARPDAPKEPDLVPRPADTPARADERRAAPRPDDRRRPHRPARESADHGDAIFKHDLPARPYQPADASVAAPIALEGGATSEPLAFLPMIEPGLARAIVSALIGRKEYDGPVDLAVAIATIARRKPLLRIPRRRRHTLRFGAQLLIDVGTGMSPYWLDAADVERLVRKIVGADRVEVVRFRGPAAPADRPTQEAAKRGPPPKVRVGERWRPYAYPPPKTPVLALSDLGFATGGLRMPDEDRWLALAAGLAAIGSSLIILTPGPRDRWPTRLAAAATLVQWDRATAHLGRVHGRPRRGADDPAPHVDVPELDPAAWSGVTHPDAYALARLVALTARCEPALLRHLRRSVLPSAEAWIEGELWFSPLADVRASAGLILRSDVTRALLDSWENDPKLPEVVEKIARAHATAPRLVRLHEQLAANVARGAGDAVGQQHVRELLAGVAAALATSPNPRLTDWARHVLRRLPQLQGDQPIAFQLAVTLGRERAALIGSGTYDRALVYSATVAADPEDSSVAFDLRSRIRPETGQRRLGVRREQGHAIFEPGIEGCHVALPVPDTWPALLDVYTAKQPLLVAVADTPVRVPWEGGPLDVYALDGQGWRLVAGDTRAPIMDAPWSSIVWTPPPPEFAFGYVARPRAIAVPSNAVTADSLEPVMVRIAGITVQTRLLVVDPAAGVAVLALEEDAAVPPLEKALEKASEGMELGSGILAIELGAAAAPRVVPATVTGHARLPWMRREVEVDLGGGMPVVEGGHREREPIERAEVDLVGGMPVVERGRLAGMIGEAQLPSDAPGAHWKPTRFALISVDAIEATIERGTAGWATLIELASIVAQESTWSAVEAAAAALLPRVQLADASIEAFARMGAERRSAALLAWATTASRHAVRHALTALESATRTIEVEIAVHALMPLVLAGRLDGPHARRARRHLDRISPAIFAPVLREHVDQLRAAVKRIEGAHQELKLEKLALSKYHHAGALALLRDRLQQHRRVVVVMGGLDSASQLGMAWQLHQVATGYLALAWTFRGDDQKSFCAFAAGALGLPPGSGIREIARRAAEVDASVLLDRFDRIAEDRDDAYAELRAFIQPFIELNRGRCIFTFRGLVPELGLGDVCEIVSFSGFPVEPEFRQHLSASLELHEHQVDAWLRALVGWSPIAATAAMLYVVLDTMPRWAAKLEERGGKAFVAALRAWLDQPGPLGEEHQLALLGEAAGKGGTNTPLATPLVAPLVTVGASLFAAMQLAEDALDGKAVDEVALGDALAHVWGLLDQVTVSTLQAIVRRAYLGSDYVRDDTAEFVIAFEQPVEGRARAIASALSELTSARIELIDAGHDADKLGFHAAPAVFRQLRNHWRRGELTLLAGLRLRWFAESNPFPAHNDPQKGHWGGLPERAGRIATATVSRPKGAGYHVRVQVTARPGAPPLRGTVRFHVHDSFPEPVIEVTARKGIAELTENVWGSFTVGIECDRGKTHLEIDLADTPEVDREFLDEDFTPEPGLAVASYGVELPLEAETRWTYERVGARPGPAPRPTHVMRIAEHWPHTNGVTASRIEGFLGRPSEHAPESIWLITRGDGKYHAIADDDSSPRERLRDRADELQDLLVAETLYLRLPSRAGASFANAYCSVHVRDVRFTVVKVRGLTKHTVIYEITQRWPSAQVKLSIAPGVGVISAIDHAGSVWKLVSYAKRTKRKKPTANAAGKKQRRKQTGR